MRRFVSLLSLVAALAHGQTVKSPKAEAEDLLNAALPFAEQMLATHGEFFPYAYAMDRAAQFVAIGASDGREHPPSKELIQLLKQGLQQGAKAGKYRATALVYDVRVSLPSSSAKTDAIAVSLNHEANYAALVFLAYRLEGGKVIMGEVFAQQEENYSFSSK